ncbi:MAG TPA: protein kinase [Polyangia bacterium]|nr:protein kinase [Polyangia bacterium]
MNTSSSLGFSEAAPLEGAEIAAPTVGAVLQGRYRLMAPIARGGMGSVFRGERVGLERPVAIKFLHAAVARDAQLVKRFEVEARAMSRLGHPNCVSVIDYGLDGIPYLVMDLVEGTPLRSLMDAGRLPPRRALSIARQILAGLEHAHGHGVIHRDIKPENILVEQTSDREDHVRLLDFGLAKLTDGGSKATVGVCLGTPSYMAPEQMDDRPVDKRVDIYTTGIVLYEMLTGRRPFDGREVADIFLQQLESSPPPFRKVLPGVALPGGLEAIVMRALEKSPAERFASALEMRDALGQVSERLDEAAPAVQDRTIFEALPLGAQVAPVVSAARERAARVRWSAIVSWCRRRRLLAAGLAAGAVVLVASSLLALRSRAPRRPPGVVAAAGPAKPGPAVSAGKLAAVDELVARGDRKQALARLRELRKENPADADYPVAQARLLFELRRYEEGLAAFRSAIRRDPQRRADPVLIRHVIDSMQNDGFAPAAQDFLRELGKPARDEVKEAARNHASARVRERSRELLRDWGAPAALPLTACAGQPMRNR